MNKSKADIRQIRKKIQDSPSADRNKPAYAAPAKAVVLDETQFRPQPLANPKTNTIIAWAVFAVTLIVYLLTQARTASFWDSGEYATCISILGVPHPPGNPFYILFGRALVSLFGGIFSHAWIAAFISGLASAFAVMFTYLVTVQLTSMFKLKDWEAMFAGVVAALLTAFSFTFWMNAVEAEVYSGLAFFVTIIIWLTLWWVQHSRDFHHQNVLLLIVYLFFLGFGVHQTALQIAPAILFIVVWPLLASGAKKGNFWYKFFGYGAALIITYLIFGAIGKSVNMDSLDQLGFGLAIVVLMVIELRKVFDRRLWLLAVGLVLVGISTHVYIPIRAADKPFINLGDPSTQESFGKYISRDQYGQTSMFDRRGSFGKHQMGYHFLRYFGWQWFKADTVQNATKIPEKVVRLFGGLFVAFLGLFGAVFHYRKNKHSFFYLLAIMLCVTLLMVFVMNLSSEEVRDRDYFFVVAYNMWTIWMGIGALGLVKLLKTRSLQIGLAGILLLLPVLNLAVQYKEHDRSREFIALDYGVNFLNSVEENAIIFTNGDNDTYPLWYAQAVRDPHAKQTPIHPSRDIYPTPESQQAISQAMNYKNTVLKGIRKDVTIANLSLLNTAWYIRQLREREGVIINWSEEQLKSLDDRENLGYIDLLFQDSHTYVAGDPAGEQKFTLDYTLDRNVSEQTNTFLPLAAADYSVLQIVKDNFGKRPIYFAVTTESKGGFDEYLREEGMVSRLTHVKRPEGEENVDFERLITNIEQVYQYRSIDDDRVFKDENMKRLITNYGTSYLRASQHIAKTGDLDKALSYMQNAEKFIGRSIDKTQLYINAYAANGQLDELDTYIDQNILSQAEPLDAYIKYVLLTMKLYHPDLFVRYMEKLLLKYPNDIDLAALPYDKDMTDAEFLEVEAMFNSLFADNKLGYTKQQKDEYVGLVERAAPDSS